MPRTNVLSWRDGAGWLILSGGSDPDVAADALAHARAGEPVAYIGAASDLESAEDELLALVDAGAPTGYLVDVLTEDDETIHKLISEAGMIVIGDGTEQTRLRSGLLGAALDGMAIAYERGAIVLAIGESATLFGSLTPDDRDGFAWVEGAIVGVGSVSLRDRLVAHPDSVGIAIGAGSALALSGAGEIELWGARQVTVTLGSAKR